MELNCRTIHQMNFRILSLLGTSKNTKKLTHVDRSTIIDGIASTCEMDVPGEDVKALNIGNIG